jgi:Ca2+-binding EF-hand superfamily protein
MKSPEKTVFETILLLAAVVALLILPLTVKADGGMAKGAPAFSEVDADGDGYVSEAELNAYHAARHQAAAEEGRPMKGMGTMPKFADIDTDGDGKLSEAELAAAHQAHMQTMHGEHAGQGKGMHHGGMKKPSFGDLDLDGNGCIDADEFAKHQAERHGKPAE